MIKAIIFDMDGVMIDSEYFCYRRFKELLGRYQADLTMEDYIELLAGRRVINGLQGAISYYHLDIKAEDLREEMLKMTHFKEEDIELKPYLLEFLQYLKQHHYKTGIATSSGLDRAKKILGHYGVLEYIDCICVGAEVAHGKPAPDIFLKAIEKLNVDHDEAIILEDSKTGVQAAYNASIPVINVIDLQKPSDTMKEQCLYICNSLEEVKNYLEENNE